MNVLQLVPALNVGGVERGTVEVAGALVSAGHKAVVVSAGGVLVPKLEAAGARHYTVPVGSKNPAEIFRCYFKLRHIIKKENIDIVHARSRIPALTGYIAALSLNKVFITTAHGQYRKHLISRVMGWGKVVICANETMARYMHDNFDVPLDKIRIVPRGVDLRKYSFIPRHRRERAPFRVGMVARYSPLKGHVDFLKAVYHLSRRVHSVEALIMGDRTRAKEEYLKKIDLTIKRLNIGGIVRFRSSEEKVENVLSELDCFVSANRYQEAFGRSVIEAQSRGVPVVATAVGGIVENIHNGDTGLLAKPGDPVDIAEKIFLYYKDSELASKVSRTAREFVENSYSLENTMKRSLEVYKEALSVKKILVFKISALGDVILAVPSLRAIKRKFPGSVLKVLVDVKFRDVLSRMPCVDDVITCDLKGRDRGKGFLRLLASLRKESFDISVDLQNNRKSHIAAFLAAIPRRYGFDNGKLSCLLNFKASMPSERMGPVEHQGRVLALMGIDIKDKSLELPISEEDRQWAKKFLRDNWPKKDQRIVALSLSASLKWQTKNWGVDQFAKLADMLARRSGTRTLIIGSGEDERTAREFISKTMSKPINAVGKTSIPRLAALMGECDALVTGDSAPMHVAAAGGLPFVALFGPTDPERHIPPGCEYRLIRKELKCSPCYKNVCLRARKCMRSISPEEVYKTLEELVFCGKAGGRRQEA